MIIFSLVTHCYNNFLITFFFLFFRWSVLLRSESPSLQLCQKRSQRRKGAPRERERHRDQNEDDTSRRHLSGGPVSWPPDADSPDVALAELRQWNGYETCWFNYTCTVFTWLRTPNASTTLMTDWHVFHGCRVYCTFCTFFDCWYLLNSSFFFSLSLSSLNFSPFWQQTRVWCIVYPFNRSKNNCDKKLPF